MSEWNFFDPASKSNLVRTITEQSDHMFELAQDPERWHAPTACGHWEVRDIIGHLVDTTDGYLRAFSSVTQGPAVPEALGLQAMSSEVDRGALSFRNKSQGEVLDHLASSRAEMIEVIANLSVAEWAELIVPHPYMGPLPASFYAAGQLIDYAIHSWDIVEGSGDHHVLDGDAADLLVPFCLIVWQHTAVPIHGQLDVGLRISGRSGGDHRIALSEEGITIEPGSIGDNDTTLDFDAAGFVLTAMGRINAGTCRGDSEVADQLLNGFFRI